MNDEPHRFFFLHMQKTGGTALNERLRRHFTSEQVYPALADRGQVGSVLDVAELTRRFALERQDLRLITGHFPLCCTRLLGVPFTTFTVLREPVDRTLSLLRDMNTRGDLAGAGLEAIYAHPQKLHGQIHNHMTKMLSLDPDEMTAGAMTMVDFGPARLDKAKQRLTEEVDLFGLQEDLEQFCGELARRYAPDLGPAITAHATRHVEVDDRFTASPTTTPSMSTCTSTRSGSSRSARPRGWSPLVDRTPDGCRLPLREAGSRLRMATRRGALQPLRRPPPVVDPELAW